jgi:uncharacterized protein YegL
MMLKIVSSLAFLLLGNVTAKHPHYECAAQAPFKANDWFEWANCEWTMEHPQKCKEGQKQRMMTCQVVCNEAEPVRPSVSKVCEKAKIDLTFLIDGSGSVGAADFQMTRNFLEDITEHLTIGANQTHVNMVQFSDRHNIETLNSTSKAALRKQIKDMVYHDGPDTLTGAGMTFVENTIFMTPLSRPDATPVFIVLTDGKAKDDLQVPADSIHAMGIETIAIGVGKNVDLAQLETIASRPSNVYAEADYASLKRLQERLTEEVCRYAIDNSNNHAQWSTVAPSSVPTLASSTVMPSSSQGPSSSSVPAANPV